MRTRFDRGNAFRYSFSKIENYLVCVLLEEFATCIIDSVSNICRVVEDRIFFNE